MVKRMLIEKRKRQRENKRKARTEIETQRHRKIGSTKQKLLGNIFVDEGLSLSLMLKKNWHPWKWIFLAMEIPFTEWKCMVWFY